MAHPTERNPVIVKVQRPLFAANSARVLIYSRNHRIWYEDDAPGLAEARLGKDFKGYFNAWYRPDGQGGQTLVLGDRVADQDW